MNSIGALGHNILDDRRGCSTIVRNDQTIESLECLWCYTPLIVEYLDHGVAGGHKCTVILGVDFLYEDIHVTAQARIMPQKHEVQPPFLTGATRVL